MQKQKQARRAWEQQRQRGTQTDAPGRARKSRTLIRRRRGLSASLGSTLSDSVWDSVRDERCRPRLAWLAGWLARARSPETVAVRAAHGRDGAREGRWPSLVNEAADGLRGALERSGSPRLGAAGLPSCAAVPLCRCAQRQPAGQPACSCCAPLASGALLRRHRPLAASTGATRTRLERQRRRCLSGLLRLRPVAALARQPVVVARCDGSLGTQPCSLR